MFGRFLDPKNDFAFKKLFGTKKHEDILIHFLNDVLEFADEATIKEVSFLSPIQDPEIAAKKESIVDVLCVDQLGRQHIVEMQVAQSKGFIKRAQYYAAKAYIKQLNKGVDYTKLREVIFLAIADFTMFPEKKDYKSDHIILDKESHEHDLKDFSFTFLELPKFQLEIDQLTTMVEKWCYFFKHAATTSSRDLEKIIVNSPIIKEAFYALDTASWSEEELRTFEQEEKRKRDAEAIQAFKDEKIREESLQKGIKKGIKKGMEKGMEKGRKEGMEKGRQEGMQVEKLAIAKNLLSKGSDLPFVAEVTGLSEEALKALL